MHVDSSPALCWSPDWGIMGAIESTSCEVESILSREALPSSDPELHI